MPRKSSAPATGPAVGAERARLAGADAQQWRRWGPYLSERAWGTVREDYSADGNAWDFFPHDHARSRAYRWNEDGLAGLSDDNQLLCFSLAFWNGADPILKERAFGLTGPQGNHGEDVKEYWWYVDSTPTHSWMRWRYVYPQRAYPYADLVDTNAARGRLDPEYELLDTGVFDEDRYFDVTVDYAKATPDDVCIRITVTNVGPEAATIHVLPTVWFRDTWTWQPGTEPPSLRAADGAIVGEHPTLGHIVLTGDGESEALFCNNATNTARLWGDPCDPYPKDGINDHIVQGAPTVNPAQTGSKAAQHHELTLASGETREIRLRLAVAPNLPGRHRGSAAVIPAVLPDLAGGWSAVMAAREAEANEFYGQVGAGATPDEALVLRQAFAGMLWSKQYYCYDVRRWLEGDPGEPKPPASRWAGRNRRWQHFDAAAVVSMPDPWEYPWFAAWDLAFHCVTLAHVDPAFAKAQLAMVMGDGWMHPTGQVPAYEWDFGAVNPPVHAWAALRVFTADGSRDIAWLRQVFQRLIVNSTWWTTKNDPEGDGVFGGGFLGMDNIGPFDRGATLPDGFSLEQSDATGWMALFALSMLEIAAVLSTTEAGLEDMALMFFEHFTLIAGAADTSGLWHEDDGFFYDQLVRQSDNERWPVAIRTMSGIIPIFAAIAVRPGMLTNLPALQQSVQTFLAERGTAGTAATVAGPRSTGARSTEAIAPNDDDGRPGLIALVDRERLARILQTLGDPEELLSPHGIRSVSAAYRGAPYVFHAGTDDGTSIDYEPAESTTALFGGNSNWRGPVWMPVNFLLLTALQRYGETLGDEMTVEYPAASGQQQTLSQVAADLSARIAGLYLPDDTGARPVWGGTARFRDDPRWRDSLLFFEYFHGDNGAGLGASHQTGWTGLIADVLLQQIAARPPLPTPPIPTPPIQTPPIQSPPSPA